MLNHSKSHISFSQSGVPDPPSKPSIQQPQIGDRHVTMQWQPGNDNYSPVRNFTIQYKKDGGTQGGVAQEWVTVQEYVGHELTIFTIHE